MEVHMKLGGGHSIFRKDDFLAKTKTDRNRPEMMCLFWMCKIGQPAWLKEGEDNKVWCHQILEWRSRIDQGKMIVYQENQKDEPHECEGKKFWGLNVQYTDEESSHPDPVSTMLFGWFCGGHTYWFPSKAKRDTSWRLLTHNLTLKPLN